jgi:hypothetical protein
LVPRDTESQYSQISSGTAIEVVVAPLDLEGLVDSACECYGTVKAHAKRLSINGPRKLTGAPRQRSPKRPAKSRNL